VRGWAPVVARLPVMARLPLMAPVPATNSMQEPQD
jgi:hypothetical protein